MRRVLYYTRLPPNLIVLRLFWRCVYIGDASDHQVVTATGCCRRYQLCPRRAENVAQRCRLEWRRAIGLGFAATESKSRTSLLWQCRVSLLSCGLFKRL